VSTEKVRALIALHEGRVSHAYQDSLGYWTIGIGHLVDKRKGGRLPDHIIDALFDFDLEEHTEPLYRARPWIAQLDEVRHAVLIDMAFNLGVPGLLTFKATLACVQAGDYSQAARQMLKSKWATQVKTRATRLARMMETGQWPAEILD
jgi:lysozyme